MGGLARKVRQVTQILLWTRSVLARDLLDPKSPQENFLGAFIYYRLIVEPSTYLAGR